jgi:hypothetical protein
MRAQAQALFYAPSQLSRAQLVQLVVGTFEDPSQDVVRFDDAAGGSSDRELAIPFLAGMDEVVVDRAELRFSALRTEQAVTDYHVATTAGADAGLVVSFDGPARIARIVLATPSFADAVIPPGQARHLVVRSAAPNAPPASGFTLGPPIFADPPFGLASPMYGPVLGGLSVTAVDGGVQLAFPDTLGSGWLIQYALGTEATNLAPVAFTSSVRSVAIAAAPRGLTLTARGETAEQDTVLWSSANPLAPDAGAQIATFTPVAQKSLARELASSNSAAAGAAPPTLPLPLRFSAASGGRIAIAASTLEATYRVHPLGTGEVTVGLAGAWAPLALQAPAGRRPRGGTLRLVATHLGRALNDGSPVPPVRAPSAGVLVDGAHAVAATSSFEPIAGDAPGTSLALAAVGVALEVAGVAEAVLELRADAAGTPGATIGAPVVRQCSPGDPLWVSFELAEPVAVATGGAPLWVTLRTTKGELRWFAGGEGSARISADAGQTWGEVDALLAPRTAPYVQLFHVTDPPRAPALQLRFGEGPGAQLALGGPAANDDHEFASTSTAVADALLDALAATAGSARATTEVLVFSRAVCDLTVAELTLDYDPHGRP